MNISLWWHSFAVAIGAWAVALLAGLAMAVTVATAGPALRRWGCAAGAVTLALPPFLPANCWLEITAAWRSTIGAEASAIAMLPLTAMVLGLGLWPVTLFLVLGAWRKLEAIVLEAEPNLRGWSLVRWVLWPAARSALKLSSVLTLTLALANFTVPTLFQVRVFTEEFWLRYNTQFDLWGALSATWPLWILPVLLTALWRTPEVAWRREASTVPPALLARRIGRTGRTVTIGLSVLVVLASLALPLGQLVIHRRTWTELPGAFAAGSLAAGNSFLSAAAVAVLLPAMALLLAGRGRGRGLSRRDHNRAGFLSRIARGAWLVFLLPGVFLSVGLIVALNRPGLIWWYSSFGIVWLALGLRYLAPAWGAISAAVQTVDPALDETARLLGAGRWAHFRLVTWAQLPGPILAMAYAVYLLCLWDVETLVLLQPPGGETLALRIFNLLHYGHAAQVNALCLVTLGIALLPLVGFGVARWSVRPQRPGLPPEIDSNPRVQSGWRSRCLAVGCGAVVLGGCSDRSAALPGDRPLTSKYFAAARIVGSRGVAPGQFNKPRSVACDRDDNLYVADITGRIQKFSPDGRFLLQWQMPQTDIGKAKGMSVDPAGNILVVEPHYQRVNHFTPQGKLVAQWGRRGTNIGEFILPRCVAVNSAGEYFLGEYTTVERVQRFSVSADLTHVPAAGVSAVSPYQLVGTWGRPGQGAGEFNRAEGIAVGPGDLVYVADSCNHRIQIFDRARKFVREYGHAGAEPGAFSFPYDVRVDAMGRQFICEFGNSRVSIYDAADQLLETVGRAGREPGEFANPWAICFDSRGNLYVADSQNHRVQKLLRRAAPLVATAGGHGFNPSDPANGRVSDAEPAALQR